MKIFCKFPAENISKLNFWLVVCIAKNFIWTTLNAIFSIFWFFAPSDSRFSNSCISAKYCPILTNHTSMESLFIQKMLKMDPYDWFLRVYLLLVLSWSPGGSSNMKSDLSRCWQAFGSCFFSYKTQTTTLRTHERSWVYFLEWRTIPVISKTRLLWNLTEPNTYVEWYSAYRTSLLEFI